MIDPADYRIEVLGDMSQVDDRLEPFLTDGAIYPFQAREWLDAWHAAVATPLRLDLRFVVVGDRSGSALLMLPLCIHRRYGIRVLTFADQGVSDYNAPLLTAAGRERIDGATFPALWRRIVAALPAVDLVWLSKMPARLADGDNPMVALPCRPHAFSAHPVMLAGEWDSFYRNRVHGDKRRESRRRRRRLNEVCRTEFVIARDFATAEPIIALMMRQKTRQYPDLPSYVGDFYLEASRRLLPEGRVLVGQLSADGTPLAALWAVIQGDRLIETMRSYDSGEYAKYAPGRLLVEDCMKHALAQGYKVYDFSIGDYSHKDDWTPGRMAMFYSRQGVSAAGRVVCWASETARRLPAEGRSSAVLRGIRRRLTRR
jgi:CelD/BcsL family acetyltransferase involved in cellulose biosynthesis